MPLPLAYVAGALPFGFLVGVVLLRFAQGADRPRAVVDGFLAWALVSYAASESFGFVRLISMGPFLVCWLAANGIVFYLLWLARGRITKFLRIEFSLPVWIVLIFVVVTLFIALTAAPNNWDSQAYHLPKIEHWLQNHSLVFYPTATAKQNDFGPLAEMLLLQTRVLSGSDIYYPLIQWLSMVASVAAVFRITRQLGGDRSQCWVAAVFLVTLPIGILESTSTQNDYVEAAFLVAFITLGLETMERPFAPLALLIEASCAGIMSGLVKPVGYMTGVGFALWIAIGLSRGAPFPALMQRAVAVALVVASHAANLPAGYIGVDIFFVLSGFLITSLLIAEHRDSGRISLLNFYMRRALRLFPCLWLMIGVVLLSSWMIHMPERFSSDAFEALFALGYVKTGVSFGARRGARFNTPGRSRSRNSFTSYGRSPWGCCSTARGASSRSSPSFSSPPAAFVPRYGAPVPVGCASMRAPMPGPLNSSRAPSSARSIARARFRRRPKHTIGRSRGRPSP